MAEQINNKLEEAAELQKQLSENSSNKSPKDNLKDFINEEGQKDRIFEDNEEEDKNNIIKYKKIDNFLNSTFSSITFNLVTVYALFGDDIRVIATNQSADIYFDGLTITAIVFFSIEIILSILAKPQYLFSFFFWLDVISTISLIFDLQLVSVALFYGTNSSTISLAKAGKASRIGTKAGRVVRLIRLIRIVKLYKSASAQKSQTNQKNMSFLMQRKLKKKVFPQTQNSPASQVQRQDSYLPGFLELNTQKNNQELNNNSPSLNPLQENKNQDISVPKESRVSKKLSDLTTKRVVIIVLLLLFIIPLFSADYYFDPPISMDLAVQQLRLLTSLETTRQDIQMQFDSIIQQHQTLSTPIVYLKIPLSYINTFQSDDFNSLRDDEKEGIGYSIVIEDYRKSHLNETNEINLLNSFQSKDELLIQGFLNTRPVNILNSGLSIGRTIFVCIVLTVGAILFAKDANDLALGPIERMRDKVIQIANNPLSSREQELIQEGEQYETAIIENAIIKIGTLLALGFGDAGSEIIGSNMTRLGDVNAIIPGKKKCAIYGFCDIRNFTDVTEILQEDVMIFVNNIGEIVHRISDRYLGAANKNIGDAFLIVWKLEDNKYTINEDNNTVSYLDIKYVNILADFATIAFMRISAKINRDPKILIYREDKRLQERIPNYKVKLGFGINIGWSIEGSIGSEYKIDASYLSPNVGITCFLESLTKQYGVNILISGEMYDLYSDSMKKYVRCIDKLFIKANQRQLSLYTVDMNCNDLPQSKQVNTEVGKVEKYQISQIKKQEIKDLMSSILSGQQVWDVQIYFESVKDLRLITQKYNDYFQKVFAEAFAHYINGQWKQAKYMMTNAQKIIPQDGPCNFLLDFMQKYSFQPPQNWMNYREVDM